MSWESDANHCTPGSLRERHLSQCLCARWLQLVGFTVMAAQANLVSWLEQHGGYVHPKLDLFSPLDNGDRGVRAKAAIPEGDQLLLVPKALCLYLHDESVSSKAQSDSPLLVLVRSLRLSPFFSAAVLVMALHAQGDSEFAPYINSLPPCHDCLLGWTKKERALLEGTDLGEDKETAAATFQRHVEPLLRLHPDTWPADRCGAAEFEWACAMVQSRAFHLVGDNWITSTSSEGSDLYLIPGIDMINHSTQPSRRSAALKLVNQPLTVMCGEPLKEVTLEGYFAMIAERDIAAGEEVLYFYGDLSDSQLLQTYGFVESWAEGESNPHNTASIPSELLLASCEAIAKALGLMEQGPAAGDGGKQGRGGNRGSKGSSSSSNSGSKDGSGSRKRKGREGDSGGAEGAVAPASMAARRALLERLGLLPAKANVVVLAEQPLTTGLLTIAQVMLMPPGDFVEYAAEFGAAQGPSSSAVVGTAPGEARGLLGREYLDDPDFREAVCFALLKAVQARLKQYSTSMEDDEALLTQHAAAQQAMQRRGGGSTQHKVETSRATKTSGPSSEGLLTWRAVCAVRVRLGEKRVLLQLKQQLMELLAEGQSGGEEEEEEEDFTDDDDLSEDSADD